MIINYLVKFFSKIFSLLIIPAILCILFDSATGLITITAGTFIFVLVMYLTFTITDIFINKDKDDDRVIEGINYWMSPWKWF